MNSALLRLIVSVLFFLSGTAALIYQVAWQRLLVVLAGGDVFAITIIVAAFMLGIGLGGLAGGALADRGSNLRNLVAFGTVELGISIFGFFSKRLFYDTLYLDYSWISGSRGITAVVLVAALLVPTSLMGMSLPLLARALISHLSAAAPLTGRLYGVNTLGAAFGALAATWALIPLFGLEGAIHCAAACNAVSALAILPLAAGCRLPSASTSTADAADLGKAAHDTSRWSLRTCLLICACSGFLALGLEIVWFRLLGVMLKSVAFTFGTLLTIYLTGIGTGSLAGIAAARRSQRPASTFLWLQFAVGIYAGLICAGFLAAIFQWSWLNGFRLYFDSSEPRDANVAVTLLKQWFAGTLTGEDKIMAWVFPVLHFALPVLFIGPPTFLMGFSYPFLQKVVHSDASAIGRRIGWMQSANIAGCMIGVVVTSVVLLPHIGTAGTLRVLVALSGVFGLLAIYGVPALEGSHRRSLAGIVALVVAAAVVTVMPGQDLLWARAHGTSPEKIRVAEDGSGVSVLKSIKDGKWVVYVNGLGQSWTPYGGVHSELGALPAMLHPNPQAIAIIGIGSGDTLYCSGGRKETTRIVSLEIIGAQLQTLRSLSATLDYPPLRGWLNDPRIDFVCADGRQYLMNSKERFDIIEADALRPNSAHSGMLYSEEYFRLLSSRLKPGGFAVTWVPNDRVRSTFTRVFPYVLEYDSILIGSNEAFKPDITRIRQSIADAQARRYYTPEHILLDFAKIPIFEEHGIHDFVTGPDADRSALVAPNTDVFPRDEFSLSALWGR